jgi:hypothetical protein
MPERYLDFPVNMTQPNSKTTIVDPQEKKIIKVIIFEM